MGQVFEAWDPRLDRPVAIKILHRGDALSNRRFVREARLQASVEHPGVCPVFEVGEAEGKPYLVMPRLHGRPLDTAASEVSLETKLHWLAQVAEAVHAAHRAGLIHRDLKPANILVETPEDGPPRPLVLDFGIARSLAGDDLTQVGDAVGTPAYMAPEQIEGTVESLDRRVDVYGLGATLYRLLAGRLLFQGSGPDVLLRVLRQEPAPLRPLGIPLDIEAIVFKCLEKDRERRYESAKALADDLHRYLDGSPVEARPVTRWVRGGKWLRRHRALVRLALVATLLLAAAVAWGAWTTWRAESRARLAQELVAQVEEVEALAHYSYLAPLHDVREDRAALRRRMQTIRDTLARVHPADRGAAHYALGRAHLALDEPERARHQLNLAWDQGYQNAEAAASLGRALSDLYRDRLTSLERVRDRQGETSLRDRLAQQLRRTFAAPQETRKQLQRSLGDPARELLAQGQTAEGPQALLVRALLRFHEGDFASALDRLAQAEGHPSWSFEPMRLEGDIRRSWAVTLHADGEREVARQQLDQARDAYARAAAVGESHGGIFRDDAQAVYLLLALDLMADEAFEPTLDLGLGQLQRALVIDPEDVRAWLDQARLQRLAAEQADLTDHDPEPWLTAGISSLEKALAFDPASVLARYELGRAYWRRGRNILERGGDPTEAFRRAFEAFDGVPSVDRDYAYLTSLGALQISSAAHQASQGSGAETSYQAAVESFQAAAALHSAPMAALTNLGVALRGAAGLPGTSPTQMLERAIETFDQARQADPEHMVPHYYLGLSRLRLAQMGDPVFGVLDPALAERAADDLRRASELAPERFQPLVGLGEVFHFQAVDLADRGEDPTARFTDARKAYGRALALAPDNATVQLNLGWTAYFEGKHQLRSGDDPRARLAEAEELCQKSLEARRRSNALLCLGSVVRLRAEHLAFQDGGSKDQLARVLATSRAFFDEILALEPEHAEAHRSLGRLFTLEAEVQGKRGEDPDAAFDQAREALDRAFELQGRDVALFWLADARWQLAWARWQETTDNDGVSVLEAVEQSLEQARQLRPSWRAVDAVAAELAEVRSRARR